MAEFKKRQETAEAERLKRREEDRKRREEAERLAKEEADREQERKDKEDRDRQKALDEFAKSMQKLSEAALRMDASEEELEEEEEVDELEEANADNPLFWREGVQTETPLDEQRTLMEEQRRRIEAVEAQRRADKAEAQRRAAEQRKLAEARQAERATLPAMPDAMVEQLATGIKMSIQGGQMTTVQAAFMLENATLSASQKEKLRKRLAAEGIAIPER